MNEQDKTKTQPFKNDKTLHQWSNQDEYKKAIAPSRDGTATRQHKSYLIIKNLDNGKPAVIDFERIKSWNKQSDNLILVEVSLMEFLWLKTMRFKTGKTLFNVFTEVKNCEQKKDSHAKAQLVGREFQEQDYSRNQQQLQNLYCKSGCHYVLY